MSGRTVIALNSEDRVRGKPDRGTAESPSRAAGGPGLSTVFSNSVSQDGRDFFQTVERKKLLDTVLSGLDRKDAVYLIEGEPGSGKSAFLRWMVQQAPAGWTFCYIGIRKSLGEKHLLERLNHALFPDPALEIEALTARIKQRVREGARIAIVLDDAERLSPFALKTLFVIKAAVEKRGGRLGLVLAASSAIRAALATPSLATLSKGRIQRLALPPFTYQQTQDYIQHCLKAADAGQEISLAPRQLRRIFSISRGLPKAINVLMQDAVNGREVAASPIGLLGDHLSHYRVFILSVAAFGLIIGGGYGVYRGMVETAPSAPVTAAVSQDHLRDLVQLPELPREMTASAAGEVGQAPQGGERAMAPPPPARPVTPPSTRTAVVPAPRPEPAPKPPIPQQGPGTAQPASGIRGNAWALAQDSSHFTVQLTSWEDEARARKYIERNGLVDKAAYVHTRSKGKDWYLVIYNTYPSLKQARQAIRQLPPALRKYGPWVRNMSSLQAEAVVD